MRPLLAALLGLALWAAPAAAQDYCAGDRSAAAVEMKPGPALRFGVTPSGAAGQLGPVPSSFAPDRPDAILGALAALRKPAAPLVTHAYTSWRNAGPDEDARLLELADRYTRAGYLFELVVRYHPSPQQEGDVAGFAEHVRRMVRLLGPERGVIAFQVTNEVNFTASPDSSDGAFAGARDALVQGVIAGHDEAQRLGHRQLEMGFNYLYRLDPPSDIAFWEHLRDAGGPRFIAALGWLGLDVYPGTFYPPASAPGSERDTMVNAFSVLRCFAEIPGVPESVPIHVQENGFPTDLAARTYERQAQALETMVRATHDFRGTYNVSDYRWFNLRDADTASPNFQQHYGLMEDDYAPKPAFDRYRALIAELAQPQAAPPASAGAPARVAIRRRCRRGRLHVRVRGTGIRRVVLRSGKRRRVDRRAPFRLSLRTARRARLRVQGERGVTRRLRGCARR